ncbi:hypothetical protein EDC04DRAFT_2641250 [Pisolithus marmoratus]|nr:hypothetical protein EDC04DRAFT_2641250 [Pisolithus marmoratus]
MRSFAALALLFTSVFAAPLDPSTLGNTTASAAIGAVDQAVHGSPRLPIIKEPSTSELTTRSTCSSIACILNTVCEEIEPLVDELLDLVPANATVAVVTPILQSITSSLLAAVPKLEALIGTEVSDLLVDVEGVTITVDALAQIVFTDLEPVFKALVKILAIIDYQPCQIFDLLVEVLNAVLAIIQVVVQLVINIVVSLGPLVAPFVPLIDCLGVTALLQLLNLSA